ncbi:MAG TPA: HAD-IA family hydrolase [Bacillota bacterium]
MELGVDSRARGLIFDIDGTLADTMPTHFRSWQEVARRYGFAYPEDWFYKNAGMSTERIVLFLNERFGYHLDPAEIARVKASIYLEIAENIGPIEPVARIARENFGKLPMALGTGECRTIAARNIRSAGLAPYFSIMVCAEDVPNPKPDPATFLKCATLMGVEPQYCQVFEDGDPGLQAARSAGMIATDVRVFI